MTREASSGRDPDRTASLVPPAMTRASDAAPAEPLDASAAPAKPVFTDDAGEGGSSGSATVLELTDAVEEGGAPAAAGISPSEMADAVDLAERLERLAVRLRREGTAALDTPAGGDSLDRLVAERLAACLVPGGAAPGGR